MRNTIKDEEQERSRKNHDFMMQLREQGIREVRRTRGVERLRGWAAAPWWLGC
jgi:hypothetical protein